MQVTRRTCAAQRNLLHCRRQPLYLPYVPVAPHKTTGNGQPSSAGFFGFKKGGVSLALKLQPASVDATMAAPYGNVRLQQLSGWQCGMRPLSPPSSGWALLVGLARRLLHTK